MLQVLIIRDLDAFLWKDRDISSKNYSTPNWRIFK